MAESIRQQTGGSFNPLSRELTLRWLEARETQKLPSRSKIAQAIEASAKSAARIEEGSLRIHGRAELEFGGIGKGFVVDAGVRVLRQLGVRFARVAGGGGPRIFGGARWAGGIGRCFIYTCGCPRVISGASLWVAAILKQKT